MTVPGPNFLKRSIFLRSISIICVCASCVYATLAASNAGPDSRHAGAHRAAGQPSRSFRHAEVAQSDQCLFSGLRSRAGAGELAASGPPHSRRQALSLVERLHQSRPRKQSGSGHRPLQSSDCEHRYSPHPGGRIFSRREYGSSAGNSRRRRRRFRHWRSRRGRWRHNQRRGRCRSRRVRIGAVYARHRNRGLFLRSPHPRQHRR